jgi:DNA-binding response OmpR family regulator
MALPLVLILEDEELIRMDLEAALGEAGFNVALARSCAEAADFLANHRPDVAALDVRLSDGECTAAAKKLIA